MPETILPFELKWYYYGKEYVYGDIPQALFVDNFDSGYYEWIKSLKTWVPLNENDPPAPPELPDGKFDGQMICIKSKSPH